VKKRDAIRLQPLSFHHENRDHDRFLVHITDAEGVFTYTVRGWSDMVRSVTVFAESISLSDASIKARTDLFNTGYALVNGFNIRVTPLS
jgi:hypothetical protein